MLGRGSGVSSGIGALISSTYSYVTAVTGSASNDFVALRPFNSIRGGAQLSSDELADV